MNDIVAIMRAADFAARKHMSQKRKGEEAEPYLNHLIEVASLVAEATDGRPDAVIAALLHDAVEDQDVTNAEIADLFGPTVASLVAEVPDDKSLPKQVRKDEQMLRRPRVRVEYHGEAEEGDDACRVALAARETFRQRSLVECDCSKSYTEIRKFGSKQLSSVFYCCIKAIG